MSALSSYTESFCRDVRAHFPHAAKQADSYGAKAIHERPFDSKLSIICTARSVLRNSVPFGPRAVSEFWNGDVIGPVHQYVISDLLRRLQRQAGGQERLHDGDLPEVFLPLQLQQVLFAAEHSQDIALGLAKPME